MKFVQHKSLEQNLHSSQTLLNIF